MYQSHGCYGIFFHNFPGGSTLLHEQKGYQIRPPVKQKHPDQALLGRNDNDNISGCFRPSLSRLGFAKATVESHLFAMKNLNFQGCIFSGIMKWDPVWEDQTRNMYGNIEGISKCIFEKKRSSEN